MPDILIRICVGACGLSVFFIAVQGAIDEYETRRNRVAAVLAVLAGQLTILRALGVL